MFNASLLKKTDQNAQRVNRDACFLLFLLLFIGQYKTCKFSEQMPSTGQSIHGDEGTTISEFQRTIHYCAVKEFS